MSLNSSLSPDDSDLEPPMEPWERILDEARPFWQRQINDAPSQAASDALVAIFHHYVTCLREGEIESYRWAERGLLGLSSARESGLLIDEPRLQDEYGFQIPSEAVDLFKTTELRLQHAAREREEGWARYLKQIRASTRPFSISAFMRGTTMVDGELEKNDTLREMVRKGIPTRMRAWL